MIDWRAIVKAWLKENERSAGWLARHTGEGISESHLRVVLAGRRDPSTDYLINLARAMDMPIGTLIDFDGRGVTT